MHTPDATTTSTSTTTSTTSTSTSTTTTSTTTTITVPTTTTMPSCSQCGVNKASGRLSCCFEGGSWFKQCGDVGDPGFAYTWYQGIQSCKRKFRSHQYPTVNFTRLLFLYSVLTLFNARTHVHCSANCANYYDSRVPRVRLQSYLRRVQLLLSRWFLAQKMRHRARSKL